MSLFKLISIPQSVKPLAPSFGAASSSDSTPVALTAFEDKFQENSPDFDPADSLREHDVFSHVLGGGLQTPKGEVFGELMEFILTMPQEKGFYPNFSKPGVKPELTLPSKDAFIKMVNRWERDYGDLGEMTPEEHLSPKEIDEFYDYGVFLLGEYIQRWGVDEGKGLFGVKGYKSFQGWDMDTELAKNKL